MACRCESGKTLITLLSCLQHVAESPSDTTTATTASTTPAAAATQSSSAARAAARKSKSTVQPVTVFCTPSGFTFHVFGPAKQSEASCELQKTLFSTFQVAQGHETQTEDWQAGGEFCVNLTSVLEALQMLGTLDDTTGRTSVGLSYNLNTKIFKVELLQDSPDSAGVLCTCAIPGLMAPADDPEGDSLSNAFRRSPVAARMMVRSGILRDLLPEWSSVAGASCASVAVSVKRGLELAVLGYYGECWVQVPAMGDHMVLPLELAKEKKTVTRTYPLHSLLSSMKGLEIAEETCININSEGIMAIQHKTVDPTGHGASNFVDFIMTCLEDEDDDESRDEDETTTADASTGASASRRTRRSTTSSQQNPETATTDKRRRRRRRKRRPQQRSSPSQDDSRTNTVNEDDDVLVEQRSSSDIEGEGTPSQRQKRQAIQKRKQQQEESDDSSSSSDEETQPFISARPLFGSLAVVARDN